MFYQKYETKKLDDVMQEEKPIKKRNFKMKKIIILISMFVVLAVITVFSIFTIKNILVDKFMHDSPTKFILNGYNNTINQKADNDQLLKVFTDSLKHGTFACKYKNDEGSKSSILSYDLENNQFYLKMSKTLDPSKTTDKYNNRVTEFFIEPNFAAVNYALDKEKRSYSIDVSNIRKDAQKSIFNIDRDNVLNFYNDSDYDNMINIIEFINKNLSQSLSENDIYNNVISAIEKESDIEISSETGYDEGENIEYDTITYTIDNDSIENIYDKIIGVASDSFDGNDNLSFNSRFNNCNDKKLVLTHYLTKGTHAVAKMDFKFTNDDYSYYLQMDFGITSDNEISITIKESNNSRINIKISSDLDNSKHKYSFKMRSNNQNITTNYIFDIEDKVFKKTSEKDGTKTSLKGTFYLTENMIKINLKKINDLDIDTIYLVSSETQYPKPNNSINILNIKSDDYNDLKKDCEDFFNKSFNFNIRDTLPIANIIEDLFEI